MYSCKTQLLGNLETPLVMGPVAFSTGPDGLIEAQTDVIGIEKQLVQEALHLLYFSLNGYKIYYSQQAEPLSLYFEKNPKYPCQANPINFALNKIDHALFQASAGLLRLRVQGENEKKIWALKVIQAIKCINESKSDNEESLHQEIWRDYLIISAGFEVLFSLNPAFPNSDLRQYLRPLLDLKYSHPVELMWKWVDQFFAIRHTTLNGQHSSTPFFIDNPNVKTPLLLVGEKLLIFAIYKILLAKTPSFINPDRVLVYFWAKEALEKKITILKLEQSSHDDLDQLLLIEEMNEKLKRSHLSKEIFK